MNLTFKRLRVLCIVQMRLHQQFLASLAQTYHPLINLGNLHACQSPSLRSHTLVRPAQAALRLQAALKCTVCRSQ